MTTQSMFRPMTVVTAFAATIGIATVAWAAGSDPEPAAQRAASVVADTTTSTEALRRAVDLAADRADIAPVDVTVRRTGGPLEATATVAGLASGSPAVIAGVGPAARAAVEQAQEAELAADTVWLTLR